MRLQELISALQEQQQKYGNIEISIDIIPTDDQPKREKSSYFHAYGNWYANASKEQKPLFTFNEDEEMGHWLSVTFKAGEMQGDFDRLDRNGLQYELNKNRKIHVAKPKL